MVLANGTFLLGPDGRRLVHANGSQMVQEAEAERCCGDLCCGPNAPSTINAVVSGLTSCGCIHLQGIDDSYVLVSGNPNGEFTLTLQYVDPGCYWVSATTAVLERWANLNCCQSYGQFPVTVQLHLGFPAQPGFLRVTASPMHPYSLFRHMFPQPCIAKGPFASEFTCQTPPNNVWGGGTVTLDW